MSYTLGVDINSRYSQVSAYTDSDRAPVPVSAILGQDRYEIPTMVAHVTDRNVWTYGFEAFSLSQAGAAFVVDDLLNRAVANEIVTVNGEEFAVIDLLELYLKRLLGMVNMIAPYQIADSIVFCVEEMDLEVITVLKRVISNLGISEKKVSLMSHSECIHYYMIHQPQDLWAQDVLIMDYSGKKLYSKRYIKNPSSKPIVCSIVEDEFGRSVIDNDEEFLAVAKSVVEGNIISSVYLIGGDEIEKDCPQTLKYLVGKRRAFMGRNLYTRGACYASRDLLEESNNKKYFFFGKDKVKCNVGLYVNNEGVEDYYELIEAGINWYDVQCEEKFYLGSNREIRLILRPIDGSTEHTAIIRLGEFPRRPDHTTYLRLTLSMEKPDVLTVAVKDLGFGQIFPASEIIVTENIELDSQGI